MRPWVLVTDDVTGQNRAAVAAVRALAASGFRPAVTVSGRHSIAAASRFCAGRVTVPPASHVEYPEVLRREADSGRFLTVLPASDVALLALGRPGAELVDKDILATKAADAGIPTVAGTIHRSIGDLHAAADRLDYPVVIKALVKAGRGDAQARRIENANELRTLTAPGPLISQPFLTDALRAVTGVIWRGKFLALSHQRYLRLWPPQAGVGCAAVTVAPDKQLEEKLARLLSTHDGVFQVQLLGDHLIDVNPRVFGSLPLSVAAGANLPAIACDAGRGHSGPLVRTTEGIRYRWIEGDLRHLVSGLRRRELTTGAVLRAVAPAAGTAHSTESLSDPLPTLVRLRSSVQGRRRRAVAE